jgi:hypothetical protein
MITELRITLITLGLLVPTAVLDAAPGARPKAPRKSEPKAPPKKPQQKEADQHFKRGVALYNEGKYAEALAEFERAYELTPHPLVLYNIAGCHRQLSHYAEAVGFYRRFLAEGKGVVAAGRLTTAQTELDGILALVARVSVTISPAVDGATLTVDGIPVDHPEMPLILPPGEHRLTARVPGRPETERTVRVASGDDLPLELVIATPAPTPATSDSPTEVVEHRTPAPAPVARRPRRFAVGAGFGTNLRLAGDTGAPSAGVAVALGSRFEVGVDAVFVATAVIPSIRVRLIGDALAVHAVGALPIAFTDGPSSDRFVAGAIGLGVRYRPMPSFALRLESYAAFADKMHGTSIPTFLGGELWF